MNPVLALFGLDDLSPAQRRWLCVYELLPALALCALLVILFCIYRRWRSGVVSPACKIATVSSLLVSIAALLLRVFPPTF